MARGKTKITLMADEKALKSTFQKRKKGVMKKIEELTILCDIIACVIIYGPVIGGRPREIFTWPKEQDKVHAAIRMFKEKMDHSRRTADLWNYLKDRRKMLVGIDEAGASSSCGFDDRMVVRSIPVELAVAYLNWVDERIKAVEERIDFLMFRYDQARNVIRSDGMLHMPAVSNSVTQDQNFGYDNGLHQHMNYQQNTGYEYFVRCNQNVCDQSRDVYNPSYSNAVADTMQFQSPIPIHSYRNAASDIVQFQSPIPNSSYRNAASDIVQFQSPRLKQFNVFPQTQTQNQNQNQIVLYDPSIRDEQNTMTVNFNLSENCQQECFKDTSPQPLNAYNSKMDEVIQLPCSLSDWSSPNGSSNYSSSSSSQFNKAIFDVLSDEDPLDYLLETPDFPDEFAQHGDGAGGAAAAYGLFGI